MRYFDRVNWRSWTTVAVGAAAVAFFVFSFQSSYLVLSDAFVGPQNHTNELRSLRRFLHGRQTLALFYDDYVSWELLGVPVSSPLLASPIPVGFNPAKPWVYGQPIDFDSVDAATLDRFAYVITTRTDAQSQPPPNFHLVGSSRSYEVWQRVGPTAPHDVLSESGASGAVLDCRTPADRRIAKQRGYAMVRTVPRYFNAGPLLTGGTESVPVTLPAGKWELSLPFTSHQAITVRGGGLDVLMPPNLDRPGEIWRVGDVRSTGAPFVLTIHVANPGSVSSTSHFFTPEPLVAVPAVSDQKLPLGAACGRYVDWYVPG